MQGKPAATSSVSFPAKPHSHTIGASLENEQDSVSSSRDINAGEAGSYQLGLLSSKATQSYNSSIKLCINA